MARTKTKSRVFLVGNARKENVRTTFDRLAEAIDRSAHLVGADLECRLDRINETEPQVVIALGGDGTILAVGQAMRHRQRPIIGVNLGKLGYLADFSADEVLDNFDRILGDGELISRRMMLDVEGKLPHGVAFDNVALNDCVLRVAQPFRTVGLTVEIDDNPVTTIVSDGLIIATPTGSTAHNMSCGGPIVQPEVDAIILTPLAPHSLTHRPVIVGPQARVGITVRPNSEGVHLVLDGQPIRSLPGGARLTLRRSKDVFQLVRNPRRKSWELLVQKLRWGQALT